MATMATSAPVDEGAAEEIARRLLETTEGRTNPYPFYHRLREASPVHRTGKGTWLLSRYDDCRAALRDPRFGKDYARQMEQRFGPGWRRHLSLASAEHSMLGATGPEHTRLRRLVAEAFTPKTIDSLRPLIERTVDGLLDGIAEARGGDILASVGFPLPVAVIGEILGVPENDRPWFRDLVSDLVVVRELSPTPAQLAAADKAQSAIRSYFFALVDEKRSRHDDDLLGRLVHAESDGDRLSDDELVTLATLLFAAGFETTTNVLGNGLLALLLHRDQMARLRENPSLAATLPDEVLRYDGTVQMVSRFTEAEVEVGGTTIPAGEQVFLLLGAANRDPARYANPDRLDLTRTDIEPLSFGGGVHHCIGAGLARAEIEIVFRRLVERFGSIELLGEQPRFLDRLSVRGLAGLVVACRSASVPRAAASDEAPARVDAMPALPSAGRGLRPGPGEADVEWRAELRRRIEGAVGHAAAMPKATGKRLDDTVALLARNRLFEACDRGQLEYLAATAYPMSFEPGDMLCVEGADSPECYVVAEGQAVVTIGRKGVGAVGEDDVVGERGVLLDTVRAATVTAMSPMITWAISRERLRTLVEYDPTVKTWMLGEVGRHYPEARG